MKSCKGCKNYSFIHVKDRQWDVYKNLLFWDTFESKRDAISHAKRGVVSGKTEVILREFMQKKYKPVRGAV